MGREGGSVAGGEARLVIGPGQWCQAGIDANHGDAALDWAD